MAGVPGTPGGINIKTPEISVDQSMNNANNANLQ
jgi:hypothetical protein